MDEIQIGKELMDDWIKLASHTKTKNEHLDSAKKYAELADDYRRKSKHYQELEEMAKKMANISRELAEKEN